MKHKILNQLWKNKKARNVIFSKKLINLLDIELLEL